MVHFAINYLRQKVGRTATRHGELHFPVGRLPLPHTCTPFHTLARRYTHFARRIDRTLSGMHAFPVLISWPKTIWGAAPSHTFL